MLVVYRIACICFLFFFKHKTAYEMRISDWSSDVCSSDLLALRRREGRVRGEGILHFGGTPFEDRGQVAVPVVEVPQRFGKQRVGLVRCQREEIGRASCRERGCQYV